MSDYLRMTREDYQAVSRACRMHSFVGSYSAFRRFLIETLRPSHPEVAARVEALRNRQVRTLREHLEGERAGRRPAAEAEGVKDLSPAEWRDVSEASALVLLRDDCPRSFQGLLLDTVGEVDPALAAKLGRLDAGQVATLYRRVKSGKRWCP